MVHKASESIDLQDLASIEIWHCLCAATTNGDYVRLKAYNTEKRWSLPVQNPVRIPISRNDSEMSAEIDASRGNQ